MASSEYIYTTRCGCSVGKVIPDPSAPDFDPRRPPTLVGFPCDAHLGDEWQHIWHRWDAERYGPNVGVR